MQGPLLCLWQMKSEREEFERKSWRVLRILQQKDQVISEVEAENSQLQCNLLAWYAQSRYFSVKHLVTLYFVVKRRSAKTGATAACSTASSNEKLTAECAELKRRLSEHSNTADANQTSDRQWRERVHDQVCKRSLVNSTSNRASCQDEQIEVLISEVARIRNQPQGSTADGALEEQVHHLTSQNKSLEASLRYICFTPVMHFGLTGLLPSGKHKICWRSKHSRLTAKCTNCPSAFVTTT
jgi:hypothetical protein